MICSRKIERFGHNLRICKGLLPCWTPKFLTISLHAKISKVINNGFSHLTGQNEAFHKMRLPAGFAKLLTYFHTFVTDETSGNR